MMPVSKPYRRTCRAFMDGNYHNPELLYIKHPRYANSAKHYVRAFLILLKDMQDLFDYIEPAYNNRGCYSFRTYELLLRACVEIEANCKAIMIENGYKKNEKNNKKEKKKTEHMDMKDYRKINASHRLSSYEVEMPFWDGDGRIRKPFLAWSEGKNLPWYGDYNATKHDRHNSFPSAKLENMIDAICGLVVILSSQFYDCDFGPGDVPVIDGDDSPVDTVLAIGGYFRIKFPSDWPDDEKYDFNWDVLKGEQDPFQEFDYSKV